MTEARPLGRFKRRSGCRVCGSTNVVSVLEFGRMPLAGDFVFPDRLADLRYYPLDLCVCQSCSLMQILNVVDPNVIFTEYRYLSSVTQTLKRHFREYAQTLRDRGLATEESFVVEFGCNDGVLLEPLRAIGVKALGIDAADNVAQIARDKGFDVITGFFGQPIAARIRDERGPADIITASNVFAHIDDLDEILKGVDALLAPNGSFIVEIHYGVDLLEKLQFDAVYHEHLCYYSIAALDVLFGRFALEIYDVERLPMHGGAIRVYSRRRGETTTPPSDTLLQLRTLEQRIGVKQIETYFDFANKVHKARDKIREAVFARRKSGRTLSAFGAAGRATILLNYCGLDSSLVEYIIDESPSRCGRVVPGVSISILPLEHLKTSPTDDCLVTAWNYREEILMKTSDYRNAGGELIFPLPELEVVGNNSEQ